MRFFCLDTHGKVIGTVDGIDGDTCWALAQLTDPRVACLKPRL
jgi:hypothetical protein